MSELETPQKEWPQKIVDDKQKLETLEGNKIADKYPNSHLFKKYELTSDNEIKDKNEELSKDLECILDEYSIDSDDTRKNNMLGKHKDNKTVNIAKQLLKDKNQIILYGPAGTGKTYNTKNIIVNHAFEKVEKIDEQYKQLQDEGRVKFVTFHQSFAYEDFIEGIKPNLEGDSDGDISYKIENGIFKELCEKSIIGNTKLVEQSNTNKKLSMQNNFWKISLGNSQKGNEANMIYDYCIENNCIALGWGKDAKNSMFERFKNEIKIGDLVFVSSGNRKIKALARVTGNFEEKDTEIRYKNYREVEWVIKDLNLPTDSLFKSYFSQMSFYSLDKNMPDIEKLNEILAGNENIEYSEKTIK